MRGEISAQKRLIHESTLNTVGTSAPGSGRCLNRQHFKCCVSTKYTSGARGTLSPLPTLVQVPPELSPAGLPRLILNLACVGGPVLVYEPDVLTAQADGWMDPRMGVWGFVDEGGRWAETRRKRDNQQIPTTKGTQPTHHMSHMTAEDIGTRERGLVYPVP